MADAADAALRIDFDGNAGALLHAGDLDDAGFADELADDFDDDDVKCVISNFSTTIAHT